MVTIPDFQMIAAVSRTREMMDKVLLESAVPPQAASQIQAMVPTVNPKPGGISQEAAIGIGVSLGIVAMAALIIGGVYAYRRHHRTSVSYRDPIEGSMIFNSIEDSLGPKARGLIFGDRHKIMAGNKTYEISDFAVKIQVAIGRFLHKMTTDNTYFAQYNKYSAAEMLELNSLDLPEPLKDISKLAKTIEKLSHSADLKKYRNAKDESIEAMCEGIKNDLDSILNEIMITHGLNPITQECIDTEVPSIQARLDDAHKAEVDKKDEQTANTPDGDKTESHTICSKIKEVFGNNNNSTKTELPNVSKKIRGAFSKLFDDQGKNTPGK